MIRVVLIRDQALARYEIARRKARTNLYAHLQWTWPVLNPGEPFQDNWHIGQLAEVVEAWCRGEFRRLLVNLPPGFTKTTLNIAASTFTLLNWPGERIIGASHQLKLSRRINDDRRTVLQSRRFQALLPGFAGADDGPLWMQSTPASACQVKKGRKGIDFFATTKQGWCQAVAVDAGITGDHANKMIIDDPHDARNVTEAALVGSHRWFIQAAESRFRQVALAAIWLNMQRLAAGDLSGRLQEDGFFDDDKGGVHIVIPMEWDQRRAQVVSYGKGRRFVDPRTQPGELANPARFPAEVVEERKRDPLVWAYQYQQEEADVAGGWFDEEWFGRWRSCADPGVTRWLGTVDASGGSTQDDTDYRAAYAVFAVWACDSKGVLRLVDQLRVRATPAQHFHAFSLMQERWADAPGMWWDIEEKAVGVRLISAFRKIARVRAVLPERRGGDKEERARAWLPHAQRGELEVPHQLAQRPAELPPEVDPATIRSLPYVDVLEPARRACLAGRPWAALEALSKVDMPSDDARRRFYAKDAQGDTVPYAAEYHRIRAYAVQLWGTPEWAEDWLREVVAFPYGAFKDQVDCATMACDRLGPYIGRTRTATTQDTSTPRTPKAPTGRRRLGRR